MVDYKALIRQASGRAAAASRSQHYGRPLEIPAGRLEQARSDLIAIRLEAAIAAALHPEEPYQPVAYSDRVRLAKMLLGEEDLL